MILFPYHDLQWPETRLCVPLFLIICAMTTIILIAGGAGGCSMMLVTLSPHKGTPTGQRCDVSSSTDMACYIQCSAVSSCRLAFVSSCQPDGLCTCNNCNGITHIQHNTETQFYLPTKEILGAETDSINLPGGIVDGQPLLATVRFSSPWTALSFETDSKVAFRVKFDLKNQFFIKQHQEVNDQGLTSGEPQTSPDFDFTDGQEVSVTYIVNSTKIRLHIYDAKVASMQHKYPLEDFTHFKVLSKTQEAVITSFRR